VLFVVVYYCGIAWLYINMQQCMDERCTFKSFLTARILFSPPQVLFRGGDRGVLGRRNHH
jgi:hypothetical protein